MVSGGARGRSGPPPDPNALRRDRKDDGETWVDLPAFREGPAPEWPLSGPASTAEQAHWTREWKRPQAVEWERLGLEVEVALYCRYLSEAEAPGATANLRNLARMEQENLGLSIPGLARHRWRITTTPPAATATPAAPAARPQRSARSSARDRFTVVPPPTDG